MSDLRKQFCETLDLIDTVPSASWYYYRDLLNDYEFHRNRNINRAYFKMWEILSQYSRYLVPKNHDIVHSCHLAEAPGSFLIGFQDFCAAKTNVEQVCSVAVSKRPNRGQGFSGHPSFHWSLYNKAGVALEYCDLLNVDDVQRFHDKYGDVKFQFITADGGIDEGTRYDEKETLHLDLIFAEVLSTLQLQDIGGSCIIKFFEMFEDATLRIVYHIAKHYRRYTIYKPTTSRPTNSERYLICHDFLGQQDTAAVHSYTMLQPVPEWVQRDLQEINDTFVRTQIEAIQHVIHVIRDNVHIDTNERLEKKEDAFRRWSEQFGYNT